MKMTEIDKFFEVLKDGKWHSINEITNKTKMKENNLKLVTSFLEEFSFIHVDKEKKKAKLDSPTRKFLQKLEKAELTSHYEEITA
jgi:hypothetical protein